MKVLLPNSMPLTPILPVGAVAERYDNESPIPAEHLDAEVLVVWGYPPALLHQAAKELSRLRLVQGLAAGPDALLAAGFSPSVTLCSGVGLHSRTVAEHALALILAMVRRLPQSGVAQQQHRWANELGGLQPLRPAGPVTTLLDARITIWGFGSIAKTLVPLLTAMGAKVTGVARSAGPRDGFDVVSDDILPRVLGETDVLVMILPSTQETTHALNAQRLSELNPDAYLINVGRGSTLDEAALIDALTAGRLAGAALDVMETEPLPKDSPLWDAPRLLLTPHAAGGRPVGADELIAWNVDALDQNVPLRNRVARS